MKVHFFDGPLNGRSQKVQGTPPLHIDRAIQRKCEKHKVMELPKLARYTLDLASKGPDYRFERYL